MEGPISQGGTSSAFHLEMCRHEFVIQTEPISNLTCIIQEIGKIWQK